jgi:formylglycine-generating enzyme required for sulfatase activity
MTERTDTIAAIEAYLKEYPQGRYAGAARIRLAALTKPAVPAVTTLGQAPSSDPETSLWNEVKTSGSREYLETYLKQYSKGKYAALAKVELKKLDEQEKQQKEQADQNAWDQAKAEHTPTAYMRYLQRYPTGRFAALAEPARQKALNDAIERDKAEAERKISEVQEAVKREETVHWQKAQNAKDSATVLAYLDRYPNGRYITEAKIRFDALKREEDEIRPGKVFKDCVECPEMIVIPAGSFEMGSNKVENEKPVHQVILRAFAMGKTEVTQGQWKAIMGNNPSRFDNCGDTCPVERVSWNDAKEFISKLNVKTGKTYRLPSEAEWEYACRAGGTHEFCGSDDVDSVARYFILVAGPGSVAAKEANAWGIYDMSGNVMELTEDCWNSNYSSAPTDGTARTSGDCTRRALRGGSWDAFASNSRAAKRLPGATTFRTMQIGFRVVRMLP